MIDDTYLTGKVAVTGEHPFVEHFRFVKALEDENTVAKQTIPCSGTVFRTDDHAICNAEYEQIL